MTCHEAREQFSALVDASLAADERAALDAHLAGCADCRRELAAFRQTVALVRGIEPARAPAGFVDRVLARARPEPWSRRVAQRLFRPWPVKLPLEAAAVVMVGLLAVWLYQRLPEVERAARTDAPAVGYQEQRSPQAPPAPRASDKQPAPTAPPAAAPPNAQAPAPRREPSPADALAPKPDSEEARRLFAKESPRVQTPAERGKLEAPRFREQEVPDVRQKAAPVESKRAPVERDGGASQVLRFAPPVPASQIAGRLSTTDRERAEQELRALVAEVGGTTVWRRGDERVTLVDVEVPRDKYAQFVAGVARLGRWTIEREASALPETVRIQVQLE